MFECILGILDITKHCNNITIHNFLHKCVCTKCFKSLPKHKYIHWRIKFCTKFFHHLMLMVCTLTHTSTQSATMFSSVCFHLKFFKNIIIYIFKSFTGHAKKTPKNGCNKMKAQLVSTKKIRRTTQTVWHFLLLRQIC